MKLSGNRILQAVDPGSMRPRHMYRKWVSLPAHRLVREDMRVGVCIGMCLGKCKDACLDMSMDIYMGMCISMLPNVHKALITSPFVIVAKPWCTTFL